MADFFDSDKKDEHLLTEDYKELVLRALKVILFFHFYLGPTIFNWVMLSFSK